MLNWIIISRQRGAFYQPSPHESGCRKSAQFQPHSVPDNGPVSIALLRAISNKVQIISMILLMISSDFPGGFSEGCYDSSDVSNMDIPVTWCRSSPQRWILPPLQGCKSTSAEFIDGRPERRVALQIPCLTPGSKASFWPVDCETYMVLSAQDKRLMWILGHLVTRPWLSCGSEKDAVPNKYLLTI